MATFEHEQLLNKLTTASIVPEDDSKFAEWIASVPQLSVLIDNFNSDEYIAYAVGNNLYVQTAIVPLEQLVQPDINDLIESNASPIGYRITDVRGGGNPEPFLEETNLLGCKSINNAQSLVFRRTFEGLKVSDASYFELLQEFAHISDIHWRDECSAYCKFDKSGNLDNIVSISNGPIDLVTVNRKALDEYLYLSNSAIVRVFYFILYRSGFDGWKQNNTEIKQIGSTHFKQCIEPSNGSYKKGFQIITPKDNDETIYSRIYPFSSDKKRQYVKFMAHDWRNKTFRDISTDPRETTNYFQAKDNNLPFEVSPAFFNAEVLSKYKANKDKYTISTRQIECRESWELKSYDINEAGQIHVYICYLRSLPYKEQQYWQVFNEKPKAGISKRAYIQDFEGGWHAPVDPLDKVKRKLQDWCDSKMTWWVLKDDSLFKNVTCPLTENKDEWADAFLRFAELVVAGLRPKKIKEALKQANIDHEKGVLSIKLLELLCESDFPALSEIQTIRNFKAHAKEAELNAHSKEIQKKHGDYPQHFNAICERLLDELDIIETRFKGL